MKAKLSPAAVGFFVIGALALAIISLISFGSSNLFFKPQRFVVYFPESIHGLNLGSPVKLRGIVVGRVAAIGVRYDAQTVKSEAAVVCEFFKHNDITDVKGASIDINDRNRLQTLVDQGLRAQLGLQGFATGLLFLELDFMDPQKFPADNKRTEVKYVVIPAVPSAISEYSDSVSKILTGLSRVDFEGMAGDAKKLLATANQKLEDVDTKKISSELLRAATSVSDLVSSQEIKDAITRLNKTLAEAQALVASVQKQSDTAGPELTRTLQGLQATLSNFNETAISARRFIDSTGNVSNEAVDVLHQLGEAADSVQRLADFLERNPNALLAGRKRSVTPKEGSVP